MHDLALPKEAPAESGAAPLLVLSAARASKRVGSDSPNAPNPPTRSHSRRFRPSHKRVPLSRRLNMACPPACLLSLSVIDNGDSPKKNGEKNCSPLERRQLL